MKEEIKQKLKDLLELILTVVIDAFIVVFVSAIAVGLKFILENWIFHSKLENITNKAVSTIYAISEIFLVVAFFFYVAWDIISLIIKFAKRLKK